MNEVLQRISKSKQPLKTNKQQ